MSRPELPKPSSAGPPSHRSPSQEAPPHYDSRANLPERQHRDTFMLRSASRVPTSFREHRDEDADETTPPRTGSHREIPFAHMRVHFDDFARQLRLHRHHEHRKRMLYHQRDRLRSAISLSARLQRVGSWVHDGLVQISQQSDATGFTRVHHHMQDLVNLCQSQWHHEIHAMDATSAVKTTVKESFFDGLSAPCQQDCLELIHTLRSNPRFLIERFKAMLPEQVKGLSTSPKFRNLSESVLVSLSENRSRTSGHRRPRSALRDFEDEPQLTRTRAYSKELEDYASSFERTNPLSFLIHNIYATSTEIESHESQLRFSTWSTVCADLFVESEPAFQAIIGEVLSAFAHLYGWDIKERLEMFLMGSLQRGAFLYNSVEPSGGAGRTSFSIFDSLSTPQAKAFFDAEVNELFQILGSGDGGIPIGALRLGRAIVEKLPDEDRQGSFRGYLFFSWFLEDFLRVAMSFPEDESMLLQFHINRGARFHLLHKLWENARNRATDSISAMPTQRVDADVQNSVIWNIGQIFADECANPYQANNPSQAKIDPLVLPSISFCAADIAHLLEKLTPQVMPTQRWHEQFLRDSTAAFNRGRMPTQFDILCRHIQDSIGPGHSSKNVHPGQESWALLEVSLDGSLSPAPKSSSVTTEALTEGSTNLNPAEEAALRLADVSNLRGSKTVTRSSLKEVHQRSLPDLFSEQFRVSHIKTDSLTSVYWHNALKYLQSNYPLTVLTGDDTKLLEPLVQKIDRHRLKLEDECLRLELEVADLESSYATSKAALTTASSSLEKLRTKLWYATVVISSNAYDDARNITLALNNMALPTLRASVSVYEQGMSPEPSRPGTSASSASSVLDQPRIDTETIMKAPAEHGGPGKLSDKQIGNTRKWLERNHVENFCRGEERIHRFCMEIKTMTQKLVKETIAESPLLWSSELFGREKHLYDIHAGTPHFGAVPSSRAPSVMSEPLTSTSYHGRAALVGSRSSTFGGSSRLGSDISSLISSAGRSTTLESTFSSPAQSNSYSVTSAGMYSRAASIFEGHTLYRTTDRSQEKATFLEVLRQDLSSLLLSDLACPVWSCGSESDLWMDLTCQTPGIMERLQQRSALAHIPPSPDRISGITSSSSNGTGRRPKRSQSVAPTGSSSSTSHTEPRFQSVEHALLYGSGGLRTNDFPFLNAFNDIICRIRDHTDPILKLKAIRDFKTLSQDFHRNQQNTSSDATPKQVDGHTSTDDESRRRSLDPSILSANLRRQRQKRDVVTRPCDVQNEENLIVQSLKELLLVLRPKTIFRDLQYISALVSSDNMDDAELDKAFLHVGLAALAWKDEVCRAMVDVADRIVAKDLIKRNISNTKMREPSILKAMEYWIIGAREGNAIAQRELASLYLTHPDVPPIVSLPLSSSSDTFKSEMMWDSGGEFRRNSQALCLALHWMQEAAKNGDVVARTKLREREAGRSIR
ncbi:hypothetical protein H2200_000858 [Cladophialophora chaetospira]|uniref:Uncharacterized protein n=1 Tax=Cladophialophora chaetospira TaxID=386627 RepID=A0AA38XPC1_9EURO|nr:hypothetical protein H2200_000858 [Cladophialophora chaetospira]